MKVLVVGASGLIGRRVVEQLRSRGDEAVVVGRSEAKLRRTFAADVTCLQWDPASGPLPAEGADAVVNLAGDPVDKGRWTKRKKKRIRDSRIVTTRNVVAGMASGQVLVSASAIGYYGDRGHTWVEEGTPGAKDFLADVCREWEAEAAAARAKGVRTAIVRIGVVLSKKGGAYPQLSMPFRMFAGGTIGDGRMWMSWIHVEDLAGIFLHCLDNEAAGGIYNGVSPNPVANREFSYTLGAVLKRPVPLMVPPIALRVIKGEFADIITASTRVRPLRTLALGYEYKYPELRGALENLEGA